MLSSIFEQNRIKKELDVQKETDETERVREIARDIMHDIENYRESESDSDNELSELATLVMNDNSDTEDEEDSYEYTPELIKSMTLEDMQQKSIDLSNSPDIITIHKKDHMGSLGNLNGKYQISFTEDKQWTECICELKNGVFHGICELYNFQTRDMKLGIWRIIKDDNSNKFEKGLINQNGIHQFGTFNSSKKLEGDDCELKTTDGVHFKGTFDNGKFIKGNYSLQTKDITFENKKGTIGKLEESKYASICLPDAGVEVLCVLGPNCNNQIVITKIISITFDNGCSVNFENKEYPICFLNGTSIDKNICIAKMKNATFTLGRYFKGENILKLDVFAFKCFLLATFPHFPLRFFNNYTDYNMTNKVLHSMEDEQYKDLGLNSLQIKQLKDKIMELGSTDK